MNLINFFNSCRRWGGKRNKFLQKIKFYGMVNLIVDYLANLTLPIYFKLTKNSNQYRLTKNKTTSSDRYIVSFTSFPARIEKVWLVVETLLRQSKKPDGIILYLSKQQFSTKDSIPQRLKQQEQRGLRIAICEGDLRSHKKYFYAMQDFPNDNIITVDDDIFYPTDFIESLINCHKKNPKAIIANWAKKILPNKEFYKEWPDAKPGEESIYMLPIGVGGVLYPPHCLYSDFCNKNIFINNCFKADDIWLSCMSILNKTPKVINSYHFSHLPIFIKNNITLLDTNRTENQGQVDNLKNHYLKTLKVNPFLNPNVK